MSDSVQPHRWQPTRLPHPWDSPGKSAGVGCHFLLQCMKVKSESEVTQLCSTLSDPMDCSLPGSSIHGIFQARVLEWGAIAFSSGLWSWTIKKAEWGRIDAFELWYWRRLLRVPWTARTSNQSILKKISPGCSLEGLILKLNLQYFGHLMRRTDSLEKDPGSGENWGQEEKGTTKDEMVGWHYWLSWHEADIWTTSRR